jgi:hypothetical protein
LIEPIAFQTHYNSRQQFLAQFAGIFVGTVVTVLTFAVLVPNAQVLGTDQFPAQLVFWANGGSILNKLVGG